MTDQNYSNTIDVNVLIHAYAQGLFPMAEDRNSDIINWYDPDPRAVIDWSTVHVPKRVKRLVRSAPFDIRFNTAFHDVMTACAEPRDYADDTWINDPMIEMYTQAHLAGFAHCMEAWDNCGQLVGGVYGIQIGAAFMAESMFSRVSNASKIALVHLMAALKTAGIHFIDVQFINDHSAQFGVIEISRDDYRARLKNAIQESVSLGAVDCSLTGVDLFLQSKTDIS